MDFDFTPVESIDKVPAQFQKLYADKPGEDGKFSVNPDFQPVAEALNGFNRSNKTLREAAKKFVPTDLSPLAEYGDTPEAIREAITLKIQEATGAKGADLKKQVDAAVAAAKEGHTKELTKAQTRAQALQDQLYGLMVENGATAAVAELKGVPELLLPFIKQQVKVTEEDGKFVVQVIDTAGEPRYGATGSLMTIKELVAEMKANEKYGRLFESERPGGGGKPPGSGRQPVKQVSSKEMTSAEKIAAGLANRSKRR